LVDLFWPGEDFEAARHNLRQALTSLRRQLEPPGVEAGAVLMADRASVGLNPAVVTTDVAEFEAAVTGAIEAGMTGDNARRLAQAAELYGAGLLPGYYDDWVRLEQDRLAELLFGALRRLRMQVETREELERALQVARRAVKADPVREEGHQELMRL